MDAKRSFVKPLTWALGTCLALNGAFYFMRQREPETVERPRDAGSADFEFREPARSRALADELAAAAGTLDNADDLIAGRNKAALVAQLPPLAGGGLPIKLAGGNAPPADAQSGPAGKVRRVSYEEAEETSGQSASASRSANAPATVGGREKAGTDHGLQIDSSQGNILDLIRRLASSDAVVVEGARTRLAHRGFSLAELELAERISRADAAERAQIVRDLPGMPGVDARQWLLGLAADVDAEVRLAAIGVLATSGDAAMMLKLEQLAVADADPRVREQVPRLQKLRAPGKR